MRRPILAIYCLFIQILLTVNYNPIITKFVIKCAYTQTIYSFLCLSFVLQQFQLIPLFCIFVRFLAVFFPVRDN